MRINARLNEDYRQKMHFLAQATQLGISDIVKQAIDLYYEKVRDGLPDAARILTETGFVGSGSGSGELSTNYKEVVREHLEAKGRGRFR